METVRSQLLGERKTTNSKTKDQSSYVLGGSFIKLEQVLYDIQLSLRMLEEVSYPRTGRTPMLPTGFWRPRRQRTLGSSSSRYPEHTSPTSLSSEQLSQTFKN